MRRPLSSKRHQRRGMILMVVLALLALFAIVGLAFVLFAQSSRRASGIFRDAWQLPFKGNAGNTAGGGGGGGGGPGSAGGTYSPPDIPATELFRWALGQLIYDTDDGPFGVQSSIRGSSLARTMYGYNDQGLNTQPFNGSGRVHNTYNAGSYSGLDDFQLVNYQFVPGVDLRDPEQSGTRADPMKPRGGFTGGANPSSTYPNLDNFYLGASRADGTLLTQSLHRAWLFGPIDPTSQNPASPTFNPNWTNFQGRFMTARPRTVDNLVQYPDGRPGFPYPTDAGGDLKNRLGYPGGNDSIWVDLGFPKRQAPDGRWFKPLFAFYVEDMDSKLNLNTAGNIMARTANGQPTHASLQGWGKWESNLARVLNRSDTPAAAVEWTNLFLGNGQPPPGFLPGRYGLDGNPNSTGGNSAGGSLARFFAQVDYNACDETNNYLPTGRFDLTQGIWPVFPKGYSNSTAAERTNHARLFDYFRPSGPPQPPGQPPLWDDSILGGSIPGAAAEIKRLWVNGFTGSDTQAAQIAQLAPKNFDVRPDLTIVDPVLQASIQAANKRRRLLVTALSMDMGRAGVSPWLYTRQTPYGSTDPNVPPSGAAVTSLTTGVVRQAVEAALEAVNLDTPLTSYPLKGNNYARYDTNPNDLQQFQKAQADRQKMASDIYLRLLWATGAPKPVDVTAPTDAELIPLRWLAQLAANIVDFIDEDEISTPFNFYPVAYQFFNGPQPLPMGVDLVSPTFINPNGGEVVPRYWVFGTELPPILLNEVYTEYSLPAVPQAGNTANFPVKVWAELYNAFPMNPQATNTQPQDQGPVPLRIPDFNNGMAVLNGWSVYQVVLANSNSNSPDRLLARVDNVVGAPDAIRSAATFKVDTVPVVGGGANVPMAVNPQVTNGMFLLGPPGNTRDNTIVAPRVNNGTPWFQTADMQYTVTYDSNANWTPNDGPGTLGLTVLLRRLANPHMPPDNNPASANYNPYITMDYMEQIKLNDVTNPASTPASVGKRQPYASDLVSQIVAQTNPNFAASPTQHTLGLPNSEPAPGTPRVWLTHLDRYVISPFELLNVSGFRPHQLTHKFITGNGPHQHLVPWFDQDLAPGSSHRLYRLFAYLDVHDRSYGVSPRGRLPGKINLNTIWDYEVFAALCDPQSSNYFTEADVQAAWRALLATRSPGLQQGADPVSGFPVVTGGNLTGNDRPLLDLATGAYPGNDPQFPNRGLEDTIFRRQAPGNAMNTLRLFQTNQAAHPYLQYELLNKISHSLTTRSNVFAVWLTTGLFEVIPPGEQGNTTTRDVLGEEIGRSDGREIRYRFFSMVDRTQLVIAPELTVGYVQGYDWTQPPPPQPVVLTPNGTAQWINIQPKTLPTDPFNGIGGSINYQSSFATPLPPVPWQINVGSVLMIDRGLASEETVIVTAVDTMTNPNVPRIQALFRREHANSMTITMPGNPGPQLNWSRDTPAWIHTGGQTIQIYPEQFVVPSWDLLN
jgi:hypothetical protein